LQMLGLRSATSPVVPVLRTQARNGVGTEAVLEALGRHRQQSHAEAPRRRDDEAQRVRDVLDLIDEEVQRRVQAAVATPRDGMRPLLDQVRAGTLDPYSAAVRILADPVGLAALLARGDAHG